MNSFAKLDFLIKRFNFFQRNMQNMKILILMLPITKMTSKPRNLSMMVIKSRPLWLVGDTLPYPCMEFKVNNLIDPAMFSYWIITMAEIFKFWPKIMRHYFILNTWLMIEYNKSILKQTSLKNHFNSRCFWWYWGQNCHST